MTENLQEKLHQGERKQLKGAKMLQNFLQNIWKIKYAKSNKTLVTLRAFLKFRTERKLQSNNATFARQRFL